MCNSESLQEIFSIVKRIMLLIQIIVPILLIVFASISFMKLVKNPEEKKGTKKIMNQFLAAAIIFFIPLLVNVAMNLVGDKSEISSCWNSANNKMSISKDYQPIGDREKKPIIKKASDYEKGTASGYLDFGCTSNKVKAQFSCDTLKIVEKYLYDFDATNFNSVINNKYSGDFGEYAKSVGGIFGEYYGKKMPHEAEADFQRAAEYVFGWMYMFGWDYKNGDNANEGEHKLWGNSHYNGYAPDAFYVHGGWVGKYLHDSDSEYKIFNSTDFDHVISGVNGGVGRMSSECGDGEEFIYNKLGIKRKGMKLHNYTRLKDLKVGDVIGFWNSNSGGHVAVVGETYDDRVVIYDGSYMVSSLNYKRVLYFPKNDSIDGDRDVIKNEFKVFDHWGTRRYYNFKIS